jgi:LAO/AO transport system kinase
LVSLTGLALGQIPANSNLDYQTPEPTYENGSAPFANDRPEVAHRPWLPFGPVGFEPRFDMFAPTPLAMSDAATSKRAVEQTAEAIRAGDRVALARAITLVESAKPEDQEAAQKLLETLLPNTGKSIRVGISGVRGAGKSTLIDQLGLNLVAQGHKVAVLAVDPTSSRSGGSILGDKTRMGRLASEPSAFIRPSPAAGTLGGVAAKTRETMLICEAAGYDVILVETVGIGQSETAVADMTDFFLALMLPGAGDELQGIKKGLVELADMIAVNKADGDNVMRARAAAAEYRAALHILSPRSTSWQVPVVTYSALTGDGIPELWVKVLEHRDKLSKTGEFSARRREQQVKWMWAILEDRWRGRVASDPKLRAKLPQIEKAVAEGRLSPALAVDDILATLGW